MVLVEQVESASSQAAQQESVLAVEGIVLDLLIWQN